MITGVKEGMKVLVIHNMHKKGSSSGDDQVFKSESQLIERYGNNEVITYTVTNDTFNEGNIFTKLKLTFGMFWSFDNYKKVKDIIKKENPDIIHIHTFFPLLSPSILYAVKRCHKKVICTLHDTRLVCPCAASIRNGELCNKCQDGKYLRIFKYKCFKNSRVMSLALAMIFKYHRIRKSFYKQIDRYICLNNEQMSLLEKTGYDKKKMIKKYNFVEEDFNREEVDFDSLKKEYKLPERYVVFYGRIGEEKGIKVLVKAWNKINDIPLVVMGSGPWEEAFKKWADKKENVHYLGYMKRDNCMSIVEHGEFVVFPSIWYEGCAMVVLETESMGKPLIATDVGFASEAIVDGKNGYKFKMKDDKEMVEKVRLLWNDEEHIREMSKYARKDFEEKYTARDNYNQLMKIYEEVLAE